MQAQTYATQRNQKPTRYLFNFDKRKKVDPGVAIQDKPVAQQQDKRLQSQSSDDQAVTAVHHSKAPNAKQRVIPFQAIQVQEERKTVEAVDVVKQDVTPLTAKPGDGKTPITPHNVLHPQVDSPESPSHNTYNTQQSRNTAQQQIT